MHDMNQTVSRCCAKSPSHCGVAAAVLFWSFLLAVAAGEQTCFVNITTPESSYAPLTYSDAVLILSAHNTARNSIRLAAAMPLLVWSPELASYVRTQLATCQLPSQAVANAAGYAQISFVLLSDVLGTSVAQLVPQLTAGQQSFTYTSESSCAAGAWCGQCSGILPSCMTYTQVIWASSLAVGCSVAPCGGRQNLVCAYGPAGNVVGKPPYTAAAAALVGCQYQQQPPEGDESKLLKILGIAGGIALFLFGGVGYFYMDGGCDTASDSKRRVGGSAVTDAERKQANAGMDVPLAANSV
jgi:pathogenesis-related protein 1